MIFDHYKALRVFSTGNQVDGLPPASSLFFACPELNFIIWLTIYFRNAYFSLLEKCVSFNLMYLFHWFKEKKNRKTMVSCMSFFIENDDFDEFLKNKKFRSVKLFLIITKLYASSRRKPCWRFTAGFKSKD